MALIVGVHKSEDVFFEFDDFDEDELGKSFLAETLQRIEDDFMGDPRHYTLFTGTASGSDMFLWEKSTVFV